MVSQVTSLSKNGVSDWLVQRVSAVVLAVYTIILVGYCALQPELNYAAWHGLFSQTWMQVLTLLAVLATTAHAWVGMWTVGSDYLREHTLGDSANSLRFYYQVVCLLLTIVYLVWGIKILWGN